MTDLTRISYSLAEAGAAVGMSERAIADAIRRGELVAHYPTKRPLVLAEDLRAWVESAPTERRTA